MSFLEPPTYENLRKRKRPSPNVTAAPPPLPPDAINPFSHAPATMKQLAVAGLTHADQLPAVFVQGFPHRPLPTGWGGCERRQPGRSRKRGSKYDEEGNGDPGKSDYDDDDDDDAGDDDDDGANASPRDSLWDSDSDHAGGGGDGDGDGGSAHRPGPDASSGYAAAVPKPVRRRERVRRRAALRALAAHDRHVGVLAAIVRRGLGGGGTSASGDVDLARAKRAFALLLRTDVLGRPVDLRQHHYWAMGAELLLRDSGADATPPSAAGWCPAHLPRVRAYYEALIQQYPYNRLWPRAVSALTFWPALLSTELYCAYVQQERALKRLRMTSTEDGGGGGDGDEADNTDADDADDSFDQSFDTVDLDVDHHRRRSASWRAREQIRQTTLEIVHDIARRMDGLMADGGGGGGAPTRERGPAGGGGGSTAGMGAPGAAPYASHPEMLRLRGMLSLYLADLVVVTPPRTAREAAEGRRLRAAERARARARFSQLLALSSSATGRRMRSAGVETDTVVDAYIERLLRGGGGDDDDAEDEVDDQDSYMEEQAARPVYAALPIRAAASE